MQTDTHVQPLQLPKATALSDWRNFTLHMFDLGAMVVARSEPLPFSCGPQWCMTPAAVSLPWAEKARSDDDLESGKPASVSYARERS
jgi:hypothetical protein